jgi:hypothetical protein
MEVETHSLSTCHATSGAAICILPDGNMTPDEGANHGGYQDRVDRSDMEPVVGLQ